MIWSLLTILAALVGGVGAVMFGQILRLYRKDMDTVRRLRSHIDYIQMMENSSEQVKNKKNALESSRDAIEELFRQNAWILAEDNQSSIHLINAIESTRIEFRDGSSKDEWTVLKEQCEAMDDEIAHVTLSGAALRYFGSKRPYPDHGSTKKGG